MPSAAVVVGFFRKGYFLAVGGDVCHLVGAAVGSGACRGHLWSGIVESHFLNFSLGF